MRRASAGTRATATSSSLRAGARGGREELGLVAGARRRGWRGWVIWKPPSGPVWAQTVGAPLSRAPSSERTGPQRTPPRSSPEPVSPARGLCSCGPAYARSRRQPYRGRRRGPARGGGRALPPAALPETFWSSHQREGPSTAAASLLSSIPLRLCPPAWWSRPRRRRRRPPPPQRPAGAEFCRRGAVTALHS